MGLSRALALFALTSVSVGTALTPHAGAAQTTGGWAVVSVHFEADLTAADGAAEVRIRYLLAAEAGGALPLDVPIAVDLLGFDDATTDRFTADGIGVELWPTTGSHRAAAVHAPTAASGSVLPMEFRYRIERAVVDDGGRLRGRIPVLSGPSPPTSEGGDAFEARLLLPETWVPSEGFPSGLRVQPDGTYAVTLQAVPSVVGFRGRSDGIRRPGLPLLMDLLTVLLLISFSAFGWRHLRGVARRARA